AGRGLALALLGIRVLPLVFATVRPLLALERSQANSMLGADIPASSLAPGGEGIWGRLKAYWKDGATWRGIGYLLLRFPIGLFTFTVVLTPLPSAVALIGTPIAVLLHPVELGFRTIAEWSLARRLVPVGLALLGASGWISEGLGAMSRSLARWGAR